MHEQEKNKELEMAQQARNKEEQEKNLEKQMASMKLAYNNLDKQREKEEVKLMQTDPKKAQQLERLGMAVGTRSSGISHSAISDMQIIQQDGQFTSKPSISAFNKRSDPFFDDMDGFFTKPNSSSNGNSSSIGGFGAPAMNRDADDDSSFRGFASCNIFVAQHFLNCSIFNFENFQANNNKASDWVVVDDNKFSDETNYSSNNYNSYLSATTQGPSILSIDNGFQK